MRLNEAIDRFKDWRGFKVTGVTVVRYDRILRMFCLYMRNKDVEKISLDDVLIYLKMMVDLKWTRNGMSLVCLALKKFFQFLNMQGLDVIDENLIPLPKKEFNIPRVCDDISYRKLIKAIPRDNNPHNQRNLALISLTWDTGARIGEILSLDVEDLDLKHMKALIKTEKSRGRRPLREIFWTQSTNDLLKKWLYKRKYLMSLFPFRDNEALFISISKCATYDVRGCRLTNRGAAEIFRMASNRAGLKANVNAHSLRHHMGRDIIMKGGSSADVTNILGHSHMDSSMIYTMMFGQDLEKRYRVFRGR